MLQRQRERGGGSRTADRQVAGAGTAVTGDLDMSWFLAVLEIETGDRNGKRTEEGLCVQSAVLGTEPGT